MDRHSQLNKAFHAIDDFFEILGSEYESYDLEKLKLFNASAFKLYLSLLELQPLIKGYEDQLLIISYLTKIIKVVGEIGNMIVTKKEEVFSQMSREEKISFLREQTTRLESFSTDITKIVSTALNLDSDESKEIVRLSLESYISLCDDNVRRLTELGEEVVIGRRELTLTDKHKQISDCERALEWITKNRDIFDSEILSKIINKLMEIYGSVYACKIIETPTFTYDCKDIIVIKEEILPINY